MDNMRENEVGLSFNSSSTCLMMGEILPYPQNSCDSNIGSCEGGLRLKGCVQKSYPDKMLISVITVVFNGEKHVRQTIESVIGQNYDNKEYIIIDGGSTDDTVDIIRMYDDRIDYWLSEPDRGIYDAMNKGIKLASGDIIALLNADDFYHDKNVLGNVINQFSSLDEFVVTDAIIINNDKRVVFNCDRPEKLYYQIPFMHPASYIPKQLYNKYGLYDLQYKVAADVDMLMKLMLSPVDCKKYTIPTVVMRAGGESDVNFISGRWEYFLIYIKYFKNPVMGLFGFMSSIIGYLASAFKRGVMKCKV